MGQQNLNVDRKVNKIKLQRLIQSKYYRTILNLSNMKYFKHNMTYTKDREVFMDEIVLIMNAFMHNKKYIVDVYNQFEDKMKEESKYEILPFEAMAVSLINHNGEHNMKYSKALYNFIYWEYEYITHEHRSHPFIYDCLQHAINYVECNGLPAFKRKYGKNQNL
jgi:hypothetical protein